jgi:hypothetical protein
VPHKGKLFLHAVNKFVIRRDEFDSFTFGESYVKTVVVRSPRLRGNINGTIQQRVSGKEGGRRAQDILNKLAGVSRGDKFLPFRFG